MNKIAVIYKSKYGFTESYARWIAEDLSADLLQSDSVKHSDLQEYDVLIFGGGLYAGGLSGISLLAKNFDSLKDKKIYIFTVGAADVTDPENISSIRSSLSRTLTPSMQESVQIYHLRGGLRYSKMSFIHRTMMSMLVKMVRKKPENELSSEEEQMLESYGQDIDFTDRQTIETLVLSVKSIIKPYNSL